VLCFETSSAEETEAAGKEIAKRLPHSGLVLLIGNLGAGKTTLAKGIVEGLGVASADEVTSPTYTIVHEYGDPVRVYHVDLYRLESTEEVVGLGLEDLLDSEALVLIEWGERFPQLVARNRYEVVLATTGELSRFIQFCAKES
jgi:tRNA threonylcarbamoyladenosine biosynthesis protein TsaE